LQEDYKLNKSKIRSKTLKWVAIAAISASFSLSGYILLNTRLPAEKTIKYKTIGGKQKLLESKFGEYIESLSYEQYAKLQKLYEATYPEYASESSKLITHDDNYFVDLVPVEKQLEMRIKGDVAVINDTLYIEDKDTAATIITRGFSYFDIPQVNITHFKYDGENAKLKKYFRNINSGKLQTLLHEMRHVDNTWFVLSVPAGNRNRAINAADELFATIAGFLPNPKLNGRSSKWRKSFRSEANTNDVNYRLSNPRQEVDSAITAALDKLENMPGYRKTFLEKQIFISSLEESVTQDMTEEEAIGRMRSAFKINGRKTDIFSLASDSVRKRAENFIKTDDIEMRIVVFAHERGIKL
jgi:hypothetical protein